jgi:hypothetical protein
MLLLDQILNKKLGKPFIKMPPDDSLPVLSPAEVVTITLLTALQKAQLSDKFKKYEGKLDCENATERLMKEDVDDY